jgi:hypothetical protein
MLGYLYAVVVGSNRGLGTLVCFPIKVHLRRVSLGVSVALSRGGMGMPASVMEDVRGLAAQVDRLADQLRSSSSQLASVSSAGSFSLDRALSSLTHPMDSSAV